MQTILVQVRAEASSLDYAECSRECDVVESRRACFAMSGQPYLCKWKNRPQNTPQMLHWQRKQSVENSPNRPTSGTATAPYSSRLQVKRYGYRGRGKDCRDVVEAKSGALCICVRYGADPRTRRAHRSEQAAAVSVMHGHGAVVLLSYNERKLTFLPSSWQKLRRSDRPVAGLPPARERGPFQSGTSHPGCNPASVPDTPESVRPA